MNAEGKFSITMQAEPPYDDADGLTMARARFDKVFEGPLEATSVVNMLSVMTATKGSAAYVATERVRGTLGGRKGAFALVHLGLMERGTDSLVLRVVPDSGSGELTGLAGTMTIRIVDGQHFYAFDYTLPDV